LLFITKVTKITVYQSNVMGYVMALPWEQHFNENSDVGIPAFVAVSTVKSTLLSFAIF